MARYFSSTKYPVFQERRYWRLPVNIGAALPSRIGIDDYENDEITRVQDIRILLREQRSRRGLGLGGAPSRGDHSDRGAGPSTGHRGGGGSG